MNSYHECKAIVELDLDPIKVKLMHKQSGENWTLERANAVEVEYRRFLYLRKAFPDEAIAPLEDVDTFWHYHILDTMKYAQDCQEVFGHFLHHFPYLGMRGDEDLANLEQIGANTRLLYEQAFGDDYFARAIAARKHASPPAAYADRPTIGFYTGGAAATAFCNDGGGTATAFCNDGGGTATAFCNDGGGTATSFCNDGGGTATAFCNDGGGSAAFSRHRGATATSFCNDGGGTVTAFCNDGGGTATAFCNDGGGTATAFCNDGGGTATAFCNDGGGAAPCSTMRAGPFLARPRLQKDAALA